MAAPAAVGYVQGLREWLTLLRALPAEAKRETIRELSHAVEPLIARARDKAPRSSRQTKVEHLQDAIKVMLRAKGVLVGAALIKGPIVHFGRSSTQRSRSGNTYTRQLHPVPWLYPALDETRDEVRARLQPAIDRAIEIAMQQAGVA